MVNEQLSMMNTSILANNTLKTAERCLLASYLMGDQKSIDFWTVALYYLKVSAADALHWYVLLHIILFGIMYYYYICMYYYFKSD